MASRRMARRIIVAGTVAWLVVAAVGVALASAWRQSLLALLPPLAIDADAVGGALTVISIGAFVIGAAHAAIWAGLASQKRWARSAGILLASVVCAGFLALAAAAAASAVRDTSLAMGLGGAALIACVAALSYGLAAARLVSELRSGSPD
jgi:hypothetical protein